MPAPVSLCLRSVQLPLCCTGTGLNCGSGEEPGGAATYQQNGHILRQSLWCSSLSLASPILHRGGLCCVIRDEDSKLQSATSSYDIAPVPLIPQIQHSQKIVPTMSEMRHWVVGAATLYNIILIVWICYQSSLYEWEVGPTCCQS